LPFHFRCFRFHFHFASLIFRLFSPFSFHYATRLAITLD
jgi:hypothetical protein